ncbi:Histidine kinase-, DNA gyrase B-, and HSP90-like ATPase [uncultured archaeon]|nr:Histidine kinase-, DNA gyrase B-, and HSP90-like ATPase [uncultured archaeon]
MAKTNEEDLNIHPSIAVQSAHETIRVDVSRALIELITNCDDSYGRLEDNGEKPKGIIKISFDESKRKFWVIDEAEGMDEKTLREKLTFGGRSEQAKSGRGYFQRGLKQAILGLGKGEIFSLKNGDITSCVLYSDKDDSPKLEVKTQHLANYEEEPFRKNFWNSETTNGTAVCIEINPEITKYPRSNHILNRLQRGWPLRFILQKPTRTVSAEFIHSTNEIESKVLSYFEPISSVILQEKITIPNTKLTAVLSLKKSKEPLEKSSEDYRDSGIIITIDGAPADCTLGKYDVGDAYTYASKFFGQLEVPGLKNLRNQVLDSGRDGLRQKHALVREIFAYIEKALKPFVDEERKLAQSSNIETELTKEKHEKLAKLLNNLASDYLKEDFEPDLTTKVGKKPVPPKLIPETIRFTYEKRKIKLNDEETITIEAPEKTYGFGSFVRLKIEGSNVVLKEKQAQLITSQFPGICYGRVVVTGKQVGAKASLIAECKGAKAVCLLEVVSQKPDSEPSAKGMFNPPRLVDTLEGVKAYSIFEETKSEIQINAKHPVLKNYLGKKNELGAYEREDSPEFNSLKAEIVSEKFFEVLVKKKKESGRLQLDEKNQYESTMNEINELRLKYGQAIHRQLLEMK